MRKVKEHYVVDDSIANDMRKFIRKNKNLIDKEIKKGGYKEKIYDGERVLWVENVEYLYLMAVRQGVNFN